MGKEHVHYDDKYYEREEKWNNIKIKIGAIALLCLAALRFVPIDSVFGDAGIYPPDYFEESYMLEEDMNSIQWIDVHKRSKSIDKVSCDVDNEVLYIDFADDEFGLMYAFYPFGPAAWEEYCEHLYRNPGKWYNKHIKGHYNCTAIHDTDDIDDKENVWPN